MKRLRDYLVESEDYEVIPNSRDLDVRNLDAMPRGVGARYLEVIRAHNDKNTFIAKQWRKRPVPGTIVIDLGERKRNK